MNIKMTVEKKIRAIKQFAEDQLMNIILPFWEKNIRDDENGGFIGEIDGNNNKIYNAPKGIILNARLLWTFSAVYGLLGDRNHHKLAIRAYEYLQKYFYDSQFDGYFWMLNNDGSLHNGKKQIYAQSFVIYALSEYSLQTGFGEAADKAYDIFKLIEDKAFDTEKNGYFEAYTREWNEIDDFRLSSLDMNEKKTMNTHLHIIEAYTRLYQIRKDKYLQQKIKNLLGLFYQNFLNTEKSNFHLFFDENWRKKSDFFSLGHNIEAAWLLRDSALILDDNSEISRYTEVAVRLAESVLQRGIGPLGGLIHEINPNDQKIEYEWWTQAEAITGFYDVWNITKEEKYLDVILGLIQFVNEYFVDKTFGEWYYRVDSDGKPVNGYEKAGFWKCPYHGTRMCISILAE